MRSDPAEHGEHEDPGLSGGNGEIGQRRSGAKPANTPAGAEQDGAEHKVAVQLGRRRHVKARLCKGFERRFCQSQAMDIGSMAPPITNASV